MKGKLTVSVNTHYLLEINRATHALPTREQPWVKLAFFFPRVYLFERHYDEWAEKNTYVGVELATGIMWRRSHGFRSLTMQILGFGVGLSIQHGY